MKHILYFLFLLFVPIVVIGQENPTHFLIDKGWQFSKANEAKWLPASVPGTVHTDLLANKKIPEPYFRANELELQWIDKEDWEYTTTFNVFETILGHDFAELRFDGLDTYADVYLNNTKILSANNMFRSWKTEVKSLLKKGPNQLRVYFYSPINKVMPLYNSLSYRVPVSNNDQAEKRVSVFTRKAGYHYGWDWGPRFVTSGIWRPVHLYAWSKANLEDVFIKQKSINHQLAELEAQVEISSSAEGTKEIQVFNSNSSEPLVSQKVFLDKGSNLVNLPFSIKDPELWWPLGAGKQNLYKFKVVLKDRNQTIGTKEIKRGLRTVEVVQQSDAKGRSFYFKVNGRPIFMKGANYIPQDNFLPRVTKERYEHLINTAVQSNMNMLRVWGGGIYENDIFYDLCDEKGIMVWQDFMFACAMFPHYEELKQNIYQEAVENVKRLRNHSSIALWNGNNEIVQFFDSDFWGHAKNAWKSPQDSLALFDTYRDIFHTILPAALKAYDEDKFYWSSSPNGDNLNMKFNQSTNKGDMHYWGVWGGKDKIENYEKTVPRFMSEYGFQSFPEIETVKEFALPADYNLNSAVMVAHQRSNRGNAGITEYMQQWFKIPSDFKKFLYVGQLLQAQAIKIAVEAHRRAMPHCMGTLYWQINDVWPAASWSSMDYFGRWKAQQYIVKNAYKETLVSPATEGDSLKVYIVSDALNSYQADLSLRLIDFSGKILKAETKKVQVRANAAEVVFSILENGFLAGYNRKNVMLDVRLKDASQEIATNTYYFEKPKDLLLTKPDIKYKLSKSGDNYSIKLNSTKLARFVKLTFPGEDIIFSDNYFDLIPGEEKVITFKTQKTINQKGLSFTSLADTL